MTVYRVVKAQRTIGRTRFREATSSPPEFLRIRLRLSCASLVVGIVDDEVASVTRTRTKTNGQDEHEHEQEDCRKQAPRSTASLRSSAR